jgi:hypothetical protein
VLLLTTRSKRIPTLARNIVFVITYWDELIQASKNVILKRYRIQLLFTLRICHGMDSMELPEDTTISGGHGESTSADALCENF